jgi:hypothetical protein
MCVHVFVVCMCVSVWLRCGMVWCGGAPLSLSLWIVAGMVVGWHDSRRDGEALGPYCNCLHADGLGGAFAGQGGSYLPQHPILHSQNYAS